MSQKIVTPHADLPGQTHDPKIVLRQDRHTADGSLELSIQDVRNPVKNFSLFGLAISSSLKFDIDDIIPETKLFLSGDLLGEYSLIVKRRTLSNQQYEYGLEVLTDTIPVDRINLNREIDASLAQIEERGAKSESLSIEFKYYILNTAAQLSQVEALCQSYESRPYSNKMERDEAYQEIAQKLGAQMFKQIKEVNNKLQSLIEVESEDQLKVGFQYFRDTLGNFIYQSPFTKRSFEKPRGYAGDFEMMNQIYRNDSHAQTLFGSCMEHAVHLHEEPTAVRNRSRYLADKIISKVTSKTGSLDFVSIACGPAEEIKLAIDTLSQDQLDRITFWLLDQDEDALKYAQRNARARALELGKRVSLKLMNKSIKQIIMSGIEDQKFDLIYSAGLFDYFSDPVATRAGKVLSKSLKTASTMIIGNFNITSPNWFGMLSLFDWRLILRSEQDLERLFKQSGHKFRVESEPKNVNLFCIIDKD